MSMGLVILIIWLLNITEHHCVNTSNSNRLFTHCLRNYTKKAATKFVTALFSMWTSQGLNLGPPDYESVALTN